MMAVDFHSSSALIICNRNGKQRKKNHKKISQIMLSTSHATHHLFFPVQVLGLVFSLLYICCCSATDTIMFNNSISDERGETLVSASGTFQLGFFTPNESPSKVKYVGIWYYNFTPQTVVWVANRDHPISDRNGSFKLTEDGKLKVLDGKGKVKWYTKFESATSSNMTAKLKDSGNLVLIDEKSGETPWESFKNPTDTFLPGMKMTESLILTSWNSSNNPATGNFTFQQDQNDDKQYNILQSGSIQHWKSGVSGKFITTDDLTSVIINFLSGGFTFQQHNFTFRGSYVDTRLVMNLSGQVQYYLKINNSWTVTWAEPRDLCGVLNACGDYGICHSKYSLPCKCLPGFQPVSPNNWYSGNFSGGCKRKTPLCGENNKKIDNFVSLKMMKVGKPELLFDAEYEKECKDFCVSNCDCRAYSYEEVQIAIRGSGRRARAECWIWSADLNNLWEEYAGGRDLYVRIATSDIDTIMFNNFISDKREETLVSARETFELGFFTPNESSNNSRYVGIWYYKLTQKTVVWVANRDSPLSDRSGSFGVTEDGNLKVLDGKGKVVWSTDLGSWPKTAKLMDSGNLVLSNSTLSAAIVWESFKNPTDTFLPGMIMDENLKLISWKTSDNPAKGSFTFQKEEGTYDVSAQGGLMQYWTSETNQMPSSLVILLSNKKYNYNKPSQQNFFYYNYSNTRVVMSFTGKIQFQRWDDNKNWSTIWWAPKDRCGTLNFCGKFGSCNINNWRVCKCLPGFHPRSPYNWSSGNFSSGCIRKSKICGKIGEKETFLSLKLMKVSEADKQFKVANETECRNEHCLGSCECQAYSYDDTVPDMCWIWTEDLTNLQEEYADEGRNIFVRVNVSDIEGSSKREMLMALIFAVTFALLIVLIATVVYYSYIRKRRLAERQQNQALYLYDNERRVMNLIGTNQFTEEDKKDIDVPFFDLKSILVATDNFSDANKLGRGGFGPVYKAKFAGGQEIAVKRLSNVSGQGLEEFKNEVILIAKLQHRNLVRLLGYCIKGEEKILLYEYMPNKSLDSFIFDRTLCVLLDWELRFNIILGIARGLLYLHQDSRLRIIHRDLKTGNILLDEDMNPKISDFGLARIFEGKQTEANTNKVVGTYGYMSPEYANYGFFSIKSDVFSFGVVVLEIISGKKVTGFYQFEQALSLLGYAWRLWNEDKALDMMDQTLCETCNANEFLKCVNIGLLCVQENPSDRPTMSNVVAMLDSKTVTLSIPKQPAFQVREDPSSIASSSSKPEACSNNELTVTELEGGR